MIPLTLKITTLAIFTTAISAPALADAQRDRPIAHEAAHVVQQRLYAPGNAHFGKIQQRMAKLDALLAASRHALGVGIKEEGVKKMRKSRSHVRNGRYLEI